MTESVREVKAAEKRSSPKRLYRFLAGLWAMTLASCALLSWPYATGVLLIAIFLHLALTEDVDSSFENR